MKRNKWIHIQAALFALVGLIGCSRPQTFQFSFLQSDETRVPVILIDTMLVDLEADSIVFARQTNSVSYRPGNKGQNVNFIHSGFTPTFTRAVERKDWDSVDILTFTMHNNKPDTLLTRYVAKTAMISVVHNQRIPNNLSSVRFDSIHADSKLQLMLNYAVNIARDFETINKGILDVAKIDMAAIEIRIFSHGKTLAITGKKIFSYDAFFLYFILGGISRSILDNYR